MITITLLLIVIAFGLSGYALIDGRFKGLTTWAVFLLALALLLPHLPTTLR